MNRAVVTTDGSAEWGRQCFCATPLAHERATIPDTYFVDFSTEEIDDHRDHDGEPFMACLNVLAGSTP